MAKYFESRSLEKDAVTIKEKYGAFAEVYAETRSEAAETVGDDASKKHWERVAATVEGKSE